MTKAEERVLRYIELRAENGVARLSIGGIARALGISKRWAQAAVRGLEKARALAVKRSKGRTSRTEIRVLKPSGRNGEVNGEVGVLNGEGAKTGQVAEKSATCEMVKSLPSSIRRNGEASPFNLFASASPKPSPERREAKQLDLISGWTAARNRDRIWGAEPWRLSADYWLVEWLKAQFKQLIFSKEKKSAEPRESLPLFDRNVVAFRKPA